MYLYVYDHVHDYDCAHVHVCGHDDVRDNDRNAAGALCRDVPRKRDADPKRWRDTTAHTSSGTADRYACTAALDSSSNRCFTNRNTGYNAVTVNGCDCVVA